MKAITLRNIPAEVQRAIRAKIRQKNISMNAAVMELLEERVGIRKTIQHHDLDELAGSWSFRKAKSFDRTIEIGRQIDEALWRRMT